MAKTTRILTVRLDSGLEAQLAQAGKIARSFAGEDIPESVVARIALERASKAVSEAFSGRMFTEIERRGWSKAPKS